MRQGQTQERGLCYCWLFFKSSYLHNAELVVIHIHIFDLKIDCDGESILVFEILGDWLCKIRDASLLSREKHIFNSLNILLHLEDILIRNH